MSAHFSTFTTLAAYIIPATIACALIGLLLMRGYTERQARFLVGAYADVRLWSLPFAIADAIICGALMSAALTYTGVTWGTVAFAIVICHVCSPGFIRILLKHAHKPTA